MSTITTGPATLFEGDRTTKGVARIYLTEPQRWEGEFFDGDPDTLWRMFGRSVTLAFDDGVSGTVMVNSVAGDRASLAGSGPWPMAVVE